MPMQSGGEILKNRQTSWLLKACVQKGEKGRAKEESEQQRQEDLTFLKTSDMVKKNPDT